MNNYHKAMKKEMIKQGYFCYFQYICAYVQLYMFVQVFVYVCAHKWEGQSSMSDIVPQDSIHLDFFEI